MEKQHCGLECDNIPDCNPVSCSAVHIAILTLESSLMRLPIEDVPGPPSPEGARKVTGYFQKVGAWWVMEMPLSSVALRIVPIAVLEHVVGD